jgi:hypothetical protein
LSADAKTKRLLASEVRDSLSVNNQGKTVSSLVKDVGVVPRAERQPKKNNE